MNYTQLRAFHAVAEAASFTKAAERQGVTQPTLSGQVRALEDIYGVKLFERRGRGVELTETGRRLRELTRRLAADESEVEALLAAARGLKSGRLSVMADAPHLILPVLGLFHRRHPGIRLAIGVGNSRAVRLALEDRRCDVAVLPDVKEEDESLHFLLLRQDKLVVMLPRDHAWSGRRAVTLKEMVDETLLLREPGSATRARLDQALQEEDLLPERVLELGSREAVAEGVAAGLGLSVVSESEFGHDRRLMKLGLKGSQLLISEYLVCLAAKREEPPIRALFETARETPL